MELAAQGKTNWKFLIIVIIVATIVGGGIFIWPDRLLNNLSARQENIISGQGTIKWISVEGGFYGIVSDDGAKYDPGNLGPEFWEDGLRVRFTAKEKKDLASFHMWGTIIEIGKIEKI